MQGARLVNYSTIVPNFRQLLRPPEQNRSGCSPSSWRSRRLQPARNLGGSQCPLSHRSANISASRLQKRRLTTHREVRADQRRRSRRGWGFLRCSYSRIIESLKSTDEEQNLQELYKAACKVLTKPWERQKEHRAPVDIRTSGLQNATAWQKRGVELIEGPK